MSMGLILFVALILGTIGIQAVRADGFTTEAVAAQDGTALLLSGDATGPLEPVEIEPLAPNVETQDEGEDSGVPDVGTGLSGVAAGEIEEIIDDRLDEPPVSIDDSYTLGNDQESGSQPIGPTLASADPALRVLPDSRVAVATSSPPANHIDDETVTLVGIDEPSTFPEQASSEPSETTVPHHIANESGEPEATGNNSVTTPARFTPARIDPEVFDAPAITIVAEDNQTVNDAGTPRNPGTVSIQPPPAELVILAAPSNVVCTTSVFSYSATGEPTSGTYTWTWTDNSQGEITHRLVKEAEGRTVTIDVNTSFEFPTTFTKPQPPIIAIFALGPDGETGPAVPGSTCAEPENQDVETGGVILAAPSNLECTIVVTRYFEIEREDFLYDDPVEWEQQWTWTDNSVGEDHHEVVITNDGFPTVTETEIAETSAATFGSLHDPRGEQFISEIRAVSGEETGPTLEGGSCFDFGGVYPEPVLVGPAPVTLVAPSRLECTTVVTGYHEYTFDGYLWSGPESWEHQWTWIDRSGREDHHEIVTTYEFQPVFETEIAGTSATTHGHIRSPNGQQFIAEIRAVSGDDLSAPLIGGKCSDFGTGVPDSVIIGHLQAPSNLQCTTVVTKEYEYVFGDYLYRGPEFWHHEWTWTDNSEGEDHHQVIAQSEFQSASDIKTATTSVTTAGGIRNPNGEQGITEIRAVSGDDQSAPLIGGMCSEFGGGVPDSVIIGPNPNLRPIEATPIEARPIGITTRADQD